MIDLLKGYIGNSIIDYFEGEPEGALPIEKSLYVFETKKKLTEKVKGKKLQPYFGNTAVFLLDDDTKKRLQKIQQELYENAGWMLAEELKPETFHMTLHDLINGPDRTPELMERMKKTETEARALLDQWRDQPPLQMKATWLFNMVDTSIVLGLAPADQDSWERLDNMYTALEAVVPLGYALTPHITMAYYRPGRYTIYDIKCLKKALHPVELDVTLRMRDLVLQTFDSMNDYQTVE